MVVEMSKASLIAVAVEMDQGCPASDAWLLLKRVKSFASQEQEQSHLNHIDLTPWALDIITLHVLHKASKILNEESKFVLLHRDRKRNVEGLEVLCLWDLQAQTWRYLSS